MKIILDIDETNLNISTIEVTDVRIPEGTGSMHTVYCDAEEEKAKIRQMRVQDLVNIYGGWHQANRNSNK